MFYLSFGLIWTLISSILLIILLLADINIAMLVIIILFEGIGIALIVKGLKIYIKDKKTDKHGEICYGVVQGVETSGLEVNDEPEYKATVAVYVESLNKVINCAEVVGLDSDEYPIGKCVKVKYFDGDINFIEGNLELENISANAQFYLKDYVYSKDDKKTNIDASVSFFNDNVVEVNGVKYKKVD